MPSEVELRGLAQLRLEEAESLFVAGYYDGCVYLCGYAVEMALKAVICRHLHVALYPNLRHFLVHDFDALVLFAGLNSEVVMLTGARRVKWQLLTGWNTAFRYNPRGSYNQQQAADWLDALRDPTDGVFPWLQTKW